MTAAILSSQKLFVDLVAADPEPNQAFRSFLGQRAMAQTDAYGPQSANFLEPKRGMARG